MCRGKVASSIVVVLGFVLIDCTPQAFARPAYGYNCVSCHSSVGFGHTTPRAIYDIVGTSQATIPAGAYGDPDRGEGPLPSYSASPGGDFRLEFQIKDPSTYDPPFTPTRWAIGIKRIYTTDPDYHAGNPDPLSWRDNQLVLQGAQPGPDYNTPDPAPIPAMSSDWSIYTLNSQQYYASAGYGGHEWIGSFLLGVDVTVPGGVLPGWYDLEVSSAGWDYDQSFAFYDEEHFYLNVVVPEPGGLALVTCGIVVSWRLRRTRTHFCSRAR